MKKVTIKKGAKKDKVTKGNLSTELQLFDEHPDHDRHLCHIVNLRNLKMVAKLSKDPKCICFVCGRTAKSGSNLCEPLKI